MVFRAGVAGAGVGEQHRADAALEEVDGALGYAGVGVDAADCHFFDAFALQVVKKCGRDAGIDMFVDDLRAIDRLKGERHIVGVGVEAMPVQQFAVWRAIRVDEACGIDMLVLRLQRHDFGQDVPRGVVDEANLNVDYQQCFV